MYIMGMAFFGIWQCIMNNVWLYIIENVDTFWVVGVEKP